MSTLIHGSTGTDYPNDEDKKKSQLLKERAFKLSNSGRPITTLAQFSGSRIFYLKIPQIAWHLFD
jgi:hypothetical protein